MLLFKNFLPLTCFALEGLGLDMNPDFRPYYPDYTGLQKNFPRKSQGRSLG